MNLYKLSPFVENQFKKSPELLSLVLGDFDLSFDWQTFQNDNLHLDVFALPRLYRQSRLALIAARDCQNPHLERHRITLKQTSLLARQMIQFAYTSAVDEWMTKHGSILSANGTAQELIIFALGKLGGNELNYSSDVDLVFCYTGNGHSNCQKPIDAHTYFNRLGRRIIQILNAFTTDGIVYRVDMRLRPFGSAAPLTCSLGNLIDYLETEGKDWERYAWLRAGHIAGNQHAAKDALQQIQPFIYRKYLDYSIFESLRQIKKQIIRKQRNDKDNIKLGTGGIREIEFIVQTLQLTLAGRNKQLRGNDLWQQMQHLHDHKHLSASELNKLTHAWLFLRKLENLCQIIDDRDSHHLPKDSSALAHCMGYNDQESMIAQLNTHKQNVNSLFNRLFFAHKDHTTKNLKNPQIQSMKDSISQRNYPKANKHKMYAALDALSPHLTEDSDNQDLIKRYHQVIHAVSKRPNYLSMLIESPLTLEKLIQQLKHSGYFSNSIATTPSLLETLFNGVDRTDFDMQSNWQFFSRKFSVSDDESHLELICQFKQRMQFIIVMAYVDKIINAKCACQHLSHLAECILAIVIETAWQQITNKTKTKNRVQCDDLIVIGYGSLAVKNMHLNSDFDLVFILDQEITDNNHAFVMRWMRRIVHLLSVQNYSGKLYQLDIQLRPNGKSGAAIVTTTNFESYQRNQAWLWEHAALIKSRAVYAADQQKTWFKTLRKNILCQNRDPNEVDLALSEMSKKLNKTNAKNRSNEFTVLGDILKQAHQNPNVIDTISCLNISYNPKLSQSIHDKS